MFDRILLLVLSLGFFCLSVYFVRLATNERIVKKFAKRDWWYNSDAKAEDRYAVSEPSTVLRFVMAGMLFFTVAVLLAVFALTT